MMSDFVRKTTEDAIAKIVQRGPDLLPKQNGQALIGVDAFVASLRIYLQKNPDVLKAPIEEILSTAFKAVCDGLMVDGKESAILPFKNKNTGKVSLQYIPMLSGSIKMIYRTGIVSSVNACVVYESEIDSFEEVRGTNPQIIHRRNKAPQGKIVASYAVAKLKDGGDVFTVLYQPDIDTAKENSRSNVWNTHPAEMWKKTAVHRLRKLMPTNMVASESIEYHESRQEYEDAIDVKQAEIGTIHQLGDMPEAEEDCPVESGVNNMLSALARA
jgi:recombination protein RecT